MPRDCGDQNAIDHDADAPLNDATCHAPPVATSCATVSAARAASAENLRAPPRRSASGTQHNKNALSRSKRMVATTCPSAVADSLHAACSQTQRSTPGACGREKASPVGGLSHLCLDPSKLALYAHDGEEETRGPDDYCCLCNENDPIAQVGPFALGLNGKDEVNQGFDSQVGKFIQRPVPSPPERN